MFPRLIFTHIGKTGGSSTLQVLSHIGVKRGRNVLDIRGASSTYALADLSDDAFAEQGLRISDYQILSGHVPFATSRKYLMPAKFVTILRDPRWQLISNYASQPPHMAKPDFNMGAFVELMTANPNAEWAIDNLQTRMLCEDFAHRRSATRSMLDQAKSNLQQHYTLVGFNEELDRFYAALTGLYGLTPPPMPRANTTGNYKEHVTAEHLAFAAARNEIDMELYEWATSEFGECTPRLRKSEAVFQLPPSATQAANTRARKPFIMRAAGKAYRLAVLARRGAVKTSPERGL